MIRTGLMRSRGLIRLGSLAAVAATTLAVSAQQSAAPPRAAALYASVGEELITFDIDTNGASLAKRATLSLPGFVQEAWASQREPFLYIAWSNGGASYAGSGVEPRGDRHGVTAFRVDADGSLRPLGPPASLRARPIHITGDAQGRYLLVAYNDPSGVSVHAVNADGSVGAEVRQTSKVDPGVYGHQVRVLPSNRAVVLVTRGNEQTATTQEDPGALKIFRFDRGVLSSEVSIAPHDGLGFRARHLDFHPTRPWVYLTLESQNRLQVYRRTEDGLDAAPLFDKSTLPGEGVQRGQTTSTVHVHPNGQFVYVGNRGAQAGGRNEIAVFRIDQETGEPSLIQNADTHGFTPRTFALDPSARLLVVGNQNTGTTGQGASAVAVPANLAVFRVAADGKLTFVQRYDVAIGRKPLWWMGVVPLR
jgi:6-phosphogluconolactonase (cycloisomerase 2 family)